MVLNLTKILRLQIVVFVLSHPRLVVLASDLLILRVGSGASTSPL